MSATTTQQTVWEAVRSYLSFITPVVNVLIAVIIYVYARDAEASKESFAKFENNLSEVKQLLIKQDKDMESFKGWMPKVDHEINSLKDKNHELEKEVIRLQMRAR